MNPRRRLQLISCLLGALLIGALCTLVGGPRSPQLGALTSGDAALAADVRSSLVDDRGYQSISAARWRDGRASFAGLGDAGSGAPTAQTPFELGSITKTFTGQLLADGVRRGELRMDDPVSTHLPELVETPAGTVTLRELATHTGGLPPFPDSMMPGFLVGAISNENSYGGPTAAMLSAARTASVTERGTYRYSNLGMSLLGHAEARAAGASDWPALATDRLLRPLGMAHTTFALDAAAVPAGAARPHAENGWPTANWWGPAFAPAGSSTWTTAEDLMKFAQAVLDGSAPGSTALDPELDIPNGEIGLAWHRTDKTGGPPVTWHNGATGGYRSMLALDREGGQAVLLLGNSVRPVDRAGIKLAATAPGAPVAAVDSLKPSRATFTWGIIGLVLVASFAYSALRGRTRLALVTAVLTGVTGLVILLAHGPWAVVPAWLWGSLTGASVVLVAVAVLRGRSLPAYAERRRVLGWLSLASTVAVLGLVVWTT